MTRMTDGRDRQQDTDAEEPHPDRDAFEEPEARSIFAAMWFRAVLVLVVLGVAAAIAVPYVLEWTSPAVALKPLPTTKPAPPAALLPPPAMVAQAPAPAPVEPQDRGAAASAPAPPKAAEKVGAAPPRRKETPKKPEVAKSKVAPPARGGGGAAGGYWVQVGAFRDPATAKRVASRLREQNYRVEESVKGGGEVGGRTAAAEPPAAGADQYDVLVSGGSVAEINARLAAKGLAAEPAASGVTIKPSLPLRDAVALSKDLAGDGFKVQVKRATASVAPARSAAADGGTTLYRVRVGGFADRAAAVSAMKELEARGYKPFIARGSE